MGFVLNNERLMSGYITINMCVNNIKTNHAIHIIVARTFLVNSDPMNKIQVDHKHHNVVDNRACALRHVTVLENNQNKLQTATSKGIVQIDQYGNSINRWDSIKAASRDTGITDRKITTSCQNLQSTSDNNNFRWEDESRHKDMTNEYECYRYSSKAVPIVQMDLLGNVLKIWGSIGNAAKGMGGKSNCQILKQMNGQGHTAFNHTWRKASQQEIDIFLCDVPPESTYYGRWARFKINDIYTLVSTMGFIITDKGPIHKGCLDSNGYYNVTINRKNMRVSRVILMTFRPIDNPDNYDADHISGIKTDNSLDNLRWLTQQQNIVAAVGMPVIAYDLNKVAAARFESVRATALQFNVSVDVIRPHIDSRKIYYGYYLIFEKSLSHINNYSTL